MPRRRRKRRQRLERREERQEAVAVGVPVREEAAPAPARATGGGISFSGVGGGLLGSGMFFAWAMQLLIDPGEASRLWAIPIALMGTCFLPAVWVSVVRNHSRRRRVLRITTVGVMITAMLSVAVIQNMSLAVVLAPPTVLLAVGAGFIFQRSGSSA